MEPDPSQQTAINSRHSRALVLGGPGTGKTEVCARWAAGLVAEGVNPAEILLLAFDQKTCDELRRRMTRVRSALPDPPTIGEPTIGTYWMVAETLLRENPAAFGLSDAGCSIRTDAEAEALWRRALGDTGIDPSDQEWNPKSLRAVVSNALNRRGNPERRLANLFRDQRAQPDAISAYRRYQALKRAGNLLDHDDLLKLWADRMKKDPAWTRQLRARFRHCAVDDFQDQTPLNAELLRLLDPARLLGFGDENQAIGSRSAADPELMEQFKTETPDTRVLTLAHNHRSGQLILDLANGILERGQNKIAIPLNAVSTEPGQLGFYAWPSPAVEIREAGKWIDRMLKAGHPPEDLCVLARSPFDLDELEGDLLLRGLPYEKLDEEPPTAALSESPASRTGRVTLGSIHSAKGLEWENVLLLGLGHRQLPHWRSTSTAALKEEKRLLYVAVTRAKNYLVCSYSVHTGRGVTQGPCPFLPLDKITWDQRACR
jgi:DNA helicase-2/ATP-dependent DNA helicase PcrA